jgi:hypothetical protein
MAQTALVRKQRLRTLEKELRVDFEKFYHTGMKLKEIRDDELYKEDGFETWEKYCKARWELEGSYVRRLITASEYRENLPSVPAGHGEWLERVVRPLTRIPDKKQAARVAAKALAEVEKSHAQSAKNGAAKPLKLTSTVVRKYVDEDLGVKRQAVKPSKPDYDDDPLSLPNYLRAKIGTIEGIISNLAKVPGEGWEGLAKKHPRLAEQLATACDELAALLRS